MPAKDGSYQEVEVTNFTTSFKNGLALCALIHRHRPDLLNYDALPKDDPHACTRTAFQIAEEHLGIPQLLDVEDLCDRPKPDERSVMTYVAQYFHAFSSMEQAEVVSRRVATFADVMQGAWVMQQDYERRARQVSIGQPSSPRPQVFIFRHGIWHHHGERCADSCGLVSAPS